MPKILLVAFNGLSEVVSMLENNENFPTIDIEALISMVIDIFMLNRDANLENIMTYIMHHVNDRIMLPDVDYAKLESIIYKLILIIHDRMKRLFRGDNDPLYYSYYSKRGNDIVLLKKGSSLHTA